MAEKNKQICKNCGIEITIVICECNKCAGYCINCAEILKKRTIVIHGIIYFQPKID